MASGADFLIGDMPLGLSWLDHVARARVKLGIAGGAKERMEAAREVVESVLAGGQPVYGVNTGFGRFSEVRIDDEDLGRLQENLIRSHASGVGPDLPAEIVRMVLIAKATSLARGYSGCRPELAELLVEMYNRGVLPVVPAHGSVGASGDLAPLAHVALVMMGEGEADVDGERLPGAEALAEAGLEPIRFGPKEGLSIINGTQVSAALAAHAWLRLDRLARAADVACAWTVEGVAGLTSPFDPRVHLVHGHACAVESAEAIREAIAGSEILANERANRVQDPYAIRCAPQVHGAVREVIDNMHQTLETELNGVTDNPLVFAATGDVISGGNFHAEPLALISDQLAVLGTELASISERRTFLLTDASITGLPPFLVEEGGLNSGFMLHHVTQASLVSACKTLSHPASVDTIPTSGGREDHVSMATWAGFKACEVADRAATVLAIEMLAAAQAVDLRAPLAPGPKIGELHKSLRERVPVLERDRYAKPDIDAARAWLLAQEW
ncbi:MAG: Histidine ammonia-lyase [Calditrichaeota bacterium]|nr:Histidine ammonia-lyase [Calditrichota bacterium]